MLSEHIPKIPQATPANLAITVATEHMTAIIAHAVLKSERHFKQDSVILVWRRGEDEIIVRAGEVVVIPSNVPHCALVLEDTLDVDVFNPPRQDWLSGTDADLRK